MSVGERSKRIGRAKSSTSLTTRLRRSVSPSMSAAASRMSSAVAPSRVSWRSAPLTIISGLRISWATIVDIRPSDDSRSRCAAFALESRDRVGERVEGGGEQTRIFVVPARGIAEPQLAGQVAGRGDVPHVIGDRRQRPRDRPRHAVADARRRARPWQAPPGRDRSESPRACASGRFASARRWRSEPSRRVEASSCGACRARTSAAYSLSPIIVRGTSSEPSRPDKPGVGVRAERRRAHLAVDGEGHVSAGQGLERGGAVVVEQVADRERAQEFGSVEVDRHRHADDLEHAVRV